MSIHLYTDAELAQQVSEGDMSSPDTDVFDGVAGEEKDRQLYIANEQTFLAAPIGVSDTALTLSDARFADGDTLIVDSEMMQVVSGGGTTAIIVQRAQGESASASHEMGARVYTACNYTDLSVQPVDTQGTDESSWCILALTQVDLDTRSPGDVLVLGSKGYSETLSFWRRISVPVGTPMHNKTDLKFRINGTESLV